MSNIADFTVILIAHISTLTFCGQPFIITGLQKANTVWLVRLGVFAMDIGTETSGILQPSMPAESGFLVGG